MEHRSEDITKEEQLLRDYRQDEDAGEEAFGTGKWGQLTKTFWCWLEHPQTSTTARVFFRLFLVTVAFLQII